MKTHYAEFAAYNAWANGRLYEAAAALTDTEYRANQSAFFKSMHGTLNHMLVADRIWMQRFTGEGATYERLDTILYERLDALRAARQAEDRRISGWIDGLDDDALSGVIRYRRVSTPEEFVQPLLPALRHFFNHQTHHRGQAHMVLTTLGKAAPPLDLLFFQRLVEAGKA
jgi:uncharacterized damage-inducible protein DinB